MTAGPALDFDEVDSTNRVAFEMARDGAREGTVVVAGRQLNGRGRMSRRWESASANGLYCSIILRPPIDPIAAPQATFVAALAAASALGQVSGAVCRIKWPNDILIGGKKVCGILSEAMPGDAGMDFIVVGFGVNVNNTRREFPAEFAANATSLYLATGLNFEHSDILSAIRTSFEFWYRVWLREGFGRVRESWLEFNCTTGTCVKVLDEGEEITSGLAKGVDDCGRLLIEDLQGQFFSFEFGEVSVR